MLLSLPTSSQSSVTRRSSPSTCACLAQLCSLLPSDTGRSLRYTLQPGAWMAACLLGSSVWVGALLPVAGEATRGHRGHVCSTMTGAPCERAKTAAASMAALSLHRSRPTAAFVGPLKPRQPIWRTLPPVSPSRTPWGPLAQAPLSTLLQDVPAPESLASVSVVVGSGHRVLFGTRVCCS